LFGKRGRTLQTGGFRFEGKPAAPRAAATGSAVLGQGEPNETVIGPTLEEDFDIVVARYDDDGLLLWARQIVGETESAGTFASGTSFRAAFLDTGELVFAGKYTGTAVFGLGEPNETTLQSTGGSHQFFISLFYPNGNLAWAIDQDGADGANWVGSVAAYGDGTFFVGGSFGGEVTFGTCSEDWKTMTSSGDSEIFVLRFDRTE
jgi:hypothetical protein